MDTFKNLVFVIMSVISSVNDFDPILLNENVTARPISIVARVATKGITFKYDTNNPLTKPNNNPIAIATKNELKNVPPLITCIAVMVALLNIADSTDKSIPAVSITNVTPHAAIPVAADCTKIFWKLKRVKNLGDNNVKTKIRTAKTMYNPYF